jgi:hypothetical protein
MLSRVIDFEYVIKQYKIKIIGKTYILAGGRQLSPILDSINPKLHDKIKKNRGRNLDLIDTKKYAASTIEEGIEQLLKLAQKNDIKLASDYSFFKQGGNLLPNYSKGEDRKLTETLAAKDILQELNIKNIDIIDKEKQGLKRPTTSSTVKDAIYSFIKKIGDGEFKDKKEFVILLQTNNPYVERQTLVAQREVNKALIKSKLLDAGYKIIIEGIGSSCNEDIKVINSELGALVAEKWINVSDREDNSYLLYQTRGEL